MQEEDPLARNRAVWLEVNAQFTDTDADAMWSVSDISWGLFRIPEAELGLVGAVAEQRVVELGCGTAYLSAWLARAGAQVVAVDLSHHQLQTARRCQRAFGPWFPLVGANAEAVPLRSGAFDLVVSEYGASPWCEPAAWVREAARLLRPGGRLVFLTNSPLVGMCVPDEGGFAGEQLLRPQRALRRVSWSGGGVEHHASHGDWTHVLVEAGLVVDELRELYAPVAAITHDYYGIVTSEWARQWPAEDVWIAHRPLTDVS